MTSPIEALDNTGNQKLNGKQDNQDNKLAFTRKPNFFRKGKNSRILTPLERIHLMAANKYQATGTKTDLILYVVAVQAYSRQGISKLMWCIRK